MTLVLESSRDVIPLRQLIEIPSSEERPRSNSYEAAAAASEVCVCVWFGLASIVYLLHL